MAVLNAGLGEALREKLTGMGAVLVGFGDLSEVDAAARLGMPVGVAVAVRHSPAVIGGIAEYPTREYAAAYAALNAQLDEIALAGEAFLQKAGYAAVAQTRQIVGRDMANALRSRLPHKTVATRAGLGWIGKCALLVTEEYGSMIRISSILTDAPLPVAKAVDEAKCGSCALCQKACPAGAVRGIPWKKGLPREAFWDVEACDKTAAERSLHALGDGGERLCGRCILACKYTQKYLRSLR